MQRVERAHRVIGEAMHHFQMQALPVEQAQNAPAALGAEIEGKQFLRGWHDQLQKTEE